MIVEHTLKEILRRLAVYAVDAKKQLKELKACIKEGEFKAVQEVKALKITAERLSDNGVYFLELVEYLEAEMHKDPTFDFGSQE